MEPGSIYADFRRLGGMEPVGAALALFAESLSPGGEFRLEGEKAKKWIYRPNNFVTFQVQTRKPVMVITLRGLYVEFINEAKGTLFYKDSLALDRDMGTYSRYRIDRPNQLLPAAYFIKLAFDHFNRPRRRSSKI